MKQKFLDLAKQLSKLSTHRSRIGSVVVRKSKPVGLGFNSLKTHTKSPSKYHCLYAEVSAVLNARADTTGCDVYVYREDKNGKMAMSKPCKDCHNFLLDVGIRRVYYTTDSGSVEEMKL